MTKRISIKAVEDLLPQTQCGDCSYDGCMPYATAIVENNEKINRCLPGGLAALSALAELCEIDDVPLREELADKLKPPAVAIINEDLCIGCTKCIQACPVDAIVGASKKMHTVISDECTGCGLCVEPCPMDCIDLPVLEAPLYDRERAKQRYQFRGLRLIALEQEKQKQHQQAKRASGLNAKQDYIQQALLRAKNKGK